MAFHSWFGSPRPTPSACRDPEPRRTAQLSVEQLEDRCVLFAPGGPAVVFLGDSITAWYADSPSWAASIARWGRLTWASPASPWAASSRSSLRACWTGRPPR